MHKLEITLKQHTPLIHFQHVQEGATLRATEVKPKLDKFILSKLGKGDYKAGKQEAKNNGWLVGDGEHGAINYKLKFIIKEDPIIMDIKKIDAKGKELPYPLFFGNIKKDPKNPDEYRKFSFLKNPFKAIFLCSNEFIKKIIENNIASFFMLNNLGTRQSKGFGSFFLDVCEQDKTYYKSPEYEYCFTVKVGNNLPIEDAFVKLYDTIDLFYKSLRSGINICWGVDTFYMKPIIFRYAKRKKLQWDKKSIKEKYYPMVLKDQQKRQDDSDILTYTQNDSQKYLFKDLLGLSVLENWEKPYKKEIIKINDEIDRFRSPIIFKPQRVGDNFFVNLILEQIPIAFLGKDFKIKSNNVDELSLKTYPDFNIVDFMNYALKIDLTSLVEYEEYEDHPKFKVLERIYNELNTKRI